MPHSKPARSFTIQLKPGDSEKLKQAAELKDHIFPEGEHKGHVKHEEKGIRLFNYEYDPESSRLQITPVDLPEGATFEEAEARIREDVKTLTA